LVDLDIFGFGEKFFTNLTAMGAKDSQGLQSVIGKRNP
jgi:hypothetical protein